MILMMCSKFLMINDIDFSKSIFTQVGEDHNMIEFSWQITDYCNYDCSYCYAKKFMNETLDNNTLYKLVIKKLEMCKVKFDITLVGGEPTRHPELTSIIKSLDNISMCRGIELYTNFTETPEYYNNLISDKMIIKLSFHPEYYNNFIKNLKLAINKKMTKFLILLNLSPQQKYWDKTLNILELCKEYNIDYEINYLTDTTEKIEYTKEFYTIFDNFINDNMNNPIEHYIGETKYLIHESQIARNNISYKGMYCIPRMLNINTNGDIYNSCSMKKLPLIIKESDVNIEFLCPHTKCACSAMIPFFKKRK